MSRRARIRRVSAPRRDQQTRPPRPTSATAKDLPRVSPSSRHPRPLIFCAWLALAATAPLAGAEAPTPERRTVGAIEHALLDAGLENVTVMPGGGIQIAFENRR